MYKVTDMPLGTNISEIMPPARPAKSSSVVRIGSAITQAMMRVTTSYLKESTARDSSASIYSVTRIPAS